MVRLTTLGRLDLAGSEGQVVRSVLQQPKRLALLVYLTMEAEDGYVRRDTVLGLFWPEHSTSRARNALNQAVHYLRRSLGRNAIVSRGAEALGVAHNGLRCDAVEFQRHLDAGEPAEALRLYRGDFLPGFYLDGAPAFERWLDRKRAGLRTLATDAAWRSSDRELEADNKAAAAHWARRAVEFTPFDEPAVRRLMRLLETTGDRAGALRAFEHLTKRLEEELEAEPSTETRALAYEIRSKADEGAATAERRPEDERTPDDERNERPASADEPSSSDVMTRESEVDGSSADDSRATDHADPSTATDGASASSASGRGWWRPRGRIAAIALFLAVVIVLWAAPRPSTPRPADVPTDRPTRIGVIRFDDFTATQEIGHIADAITTTLVDRLATVSALEIVARDRPPTAPDARSVGLDSVSDEVDVDLLVHGNIMRSDDVLRVGVRLVDAETLTTLEAINVQEPYGEMFTLVDAVAQQVSSALRIELGREVRLQRWRAGTENVEAWEALQRAQWYRDRARGLARSGGTDAAQAALAEADSLLVRAARLDPEWAEPYVLRASNAERLGWIRYSPALDSSEPYRRYWEEGIAHATRALERDAEHAGALELRGILHHLLWMFAAGDSADVLITAAERDLHRAVDIDRTHARAWSRLSSIMFVQGRYSEANLSAERAYTSDAYLDNVHEILARLVDTSLELGDLDAAERWCNELRRRTGRGFLSGQCRLSILAWSPPADSIDPGHVQAILDDIEIPAQMQAVLRRPLDLLAATAFARMGERERALAILDDEPATRRDPEWLRYEAMARTALGDENQAIDLLQAYVSERSFAATGTIQSRIFDRLRDRPNFPRLDSLEVFRSP